MELSGMKVIHGVFGNGEVVETSNDSITVKFKDKTLKFVFPDAFEKFLKAEDAVVQSQILSALSEKRAAKEGKSRNEAAAREAQRERKTSSMRRSI